MDEEEMKQDFVENYTKPGHPIFHAGIDKIYEHYNKQLSKEKITKLLLLLRHGLFLIKMKANYSCFNYILIRLNITI